MPFLFFIILSWKFDIIYNDIRITIGGENYEHFKYRARYYNDVFGHCDDIGRNSAINTVCENKN